MSSSAANFRQTVGGTETALLSFLVVFPFSLSEDDTRDSELLANEVTKEEFIWQEKSEFEGRVELVAEDEDDKEFGEHVEVVASLESSVRKEVSVAFSTWVGLIVAFSTWVGLTIWSKPKFGLLSCPFPPRRGPTLLDLFRKYHFCFVHSASAFF